MNRALRALAVVPVVAVLGWCATEAWDIAAAGALVSRAAAQIARQPAGVSLDAGPRQQLSDALVIAPRDPTANELLGLGNVRGADSREMRLQGLERLRTALVLRPVSPHAWAALAEAHYRSGDTGPVFEAALVNAMALGAAEPDVQAMVLLHGLAVLDELGPAARTAVERAAAIGFRRNPGEILRIAERRGRLDIACRQVPGPGRPPDANWVKLCQGREAK